MDKFVINNRSICTCFVAALLLGGSLYISLSAKNGPFEKYEKSMDSEQLKIYKEIRNERTKIYSNGAILGLILSLIYLFMNRENGIFNTNILVKHGCAIMTIFFVTINAFYSFYPKSKYMLNYLNTREQIDLWLETYLYMKNKYDIGLILGACGYAIAKYYQ